jgi:hypothetical protein
VNIQNKTLPMLACQRDLLQVVSLLLLLVTHDADIAWQAEQSWPHSARVPGQKTEEINERTANHANSGFVLKCAELGAVFLSLLLTCFLHIIAFISQQQQVN